MRERPIMFNGAMVPAVLAGQQTQTRRVLKMARGFNLIGGRGEEFHAPQNCGAEGGDGRYSTSLLRDAPMRVLPHGLGRCDPCFNHRGDRIRVVTWRLADHLSPGLAQLIKSLHRFFQACSHSVPLSTDHSHGLSLRSRRKWKLVSLYRDDDIGHSFNNFRTHCIKVWKRVLEGRHIHALRKPARVIKARANYILSSKVSNRAFQVEGLLACFGDYQLQNAICNPLSCPRSISRRSQANVQGDQGCTGCGNCRSPAGCFSSPKRRYSENKDSRSSAKGGESRPNNDRTFHDLHAGSGLVKSLHSCMQLSEVVA